jgi:hypothetical protein
MYILDAAGKMAREPAGRVRINAARRSPNSVTKHPLTVAGCGPALPLKKKKMNPEPST